MKLVQKSSAFIFANNNNLKDVVVEQTSFTKAIKENKIYLGINLRKT